MKLTTARLKKLIREEIQRLKEFESDEEFRKGRLKYKKIGFDKVYTQIAKKLEQLIREKTKPYMMKAEGEKFFNELNDMSKADFDGTKASTLDKEQLMKAKQEMIKAAPRAFGIDIKSILPSLNPFFDGMLQAYSSTVEKFEQ